MAVAAGEPFPWGVLQKKALVQSLVEQLGRALYSCRGVDPLRLVGVELVAVVEGAVDWPAVAVEVCHWYQGLAACSDP